MIAALAFVRRIPSLLSPKGWIAVAVLAAFLLFGAYCAHRAVQGERDRQAGGLMRDGRAAAARVRNGVSGAAGTARAPRQW